MLSSTDIITSKRKVDLNRKYIPDGKGLIKNFNLNAL